MDEQTLEKNDVLQELLKSEYKTRKNDNRRLSRQMA